MIKPVFTFVPCVKDMLMWFIVDDYQDVASQCEVKGTISPLHKKRQKLIKQLYTGTLKKRFWPLEFSKRVCIW